MTYHLLNLLLFIVCILYRIFLLGERYNEMACRYDQPNSVRSNCNGLYIHPGMPITTTCKQNYYLKGPSVAKCKDAKRSKCLPCSCSRLGSKSSECTDQTGKFSCRFRPTAKSKWYGDKCNDRDCVQIWHGYSR